MTKTLHDLGGYYTSYACIKHKANYTAINVCRICQTDNSIMFIYFIKSNMILAKTH